MLIMFKVKNFASFRETACLDMRATSYKQHKNHLLNYESNTNLLKTISLYGANASGKSNFISAMFFLKQYIFNQFIFDDQEIFSANKPKLEMVKLDQFQLDDNTDSVSEFEIIFKFNNKVIQYGFECNLDKIISEWYYIDNQEVFTREETNINYGNTYKKYLKDYVKVPSSRLYISVLWYFLEDASKELILSDFINFFANDYNVFTEIFFEASIKSIGGMFKLSERLLEDNEFKEKIEFYLKEADVGISGLEIVENVEFNDLKGENEVVKIVKTIHKIYDENGEYINNKFFDLSMESSGTIRFLTYIQEIIQMIESGGVFIVDEMSARLHPLLTKLIVDLFQSEKNTKAQLIFTTHDISILNKNQFRRDEILFVQKDRKGESKLIVLSDLKVRDDASFDKDYIRGKYGAIPMFDYDRIFGGDGIA